MESRKYDTIVDMNLKSFSLLLTLEEVSNLKGEALTNMKKIGEQVEDARKKCRQAQISLNNMEREMFRARKELRERAKEAILFLNDGIAKEREIAGNLYREQRAAFKEAGTFSGEHRTWQFEIDPENEAWKEILETTGIIRELERFTMHGRITPSAGKRNENGAGKVTDAEQLDVIAALLEQQEGKKRYAPESDGIKPDGFRAIGAEIQRLEAVLEAAEMEARQASDALRDLLYNPDSGLVSVAQKARESLLRNNADPGSEQLRMVEAIMFYNPMTA